MGHSFITPSQTPQTNKDTLTLSMSSKVITNILKTTGLEDKEMNYVKTYLSENASGEQLIGAYRTTWPFYVKFKESPWTDPVEIWVRLVGVIIIIGLIL